MREGALLIRVDGLDLRPKPLQRPSPPIRVAARKRRAVELAAEIGDVWYADPITPIPIIARNQVHWREALRAHGRNDAGFA
jgi:alkanesulfonate monooxygenase SsuD/methylene tetrahydromethanopterin reductase-like flavin-dependent oxidoreductase (luciferase family)